MSGVTPNSNILDALDEVIKSLNDLTNRPISVQVSGCCCGGGGGGAPPLPPGTDPTEGSTPPEGYEEYTNVNVTACKKAAFVYFGTLQAITELAKYENTIEIGFLVAVGAITAAYLNLGGVAGLVVAKISGIVDLITAALNTTTDLDDLKQVWMEKQDDLICALYTAAQSGSGASYSGTLGEINSILSDGGASTGNLGVISSILCVETLTILWYNPTFRDVTIEQQIADYELPEGVDCSGCIQGEFVIEVWGTLIKDGNAYTGQSQVNETIYGDIHRLNFYVQGAPGLLIKDWVSDETFGAYYNQFTFPGPDQQNWQWLPTQGNPTGSFSQSDLDNYGCCQVMRLASLAPFEVSFTVETCPE